MNTSLFDIPVTSPPASSWAKVASLTTKRHHTASGPPPPATSTPTLKPMASPYLTTFETTVPRSQTPSPNTRPVPTPPDFPPFEEVQMFSERLMVRHSSEPAGRLIDPFYVEIHVHPNHCPPTAKQDVGELMKIVLEEIHVVPDSEYFFNGNVVLCYTVFPYRKTAAQVQRLNLGYELAWKARAMWKRDLAAALTRALVEVIPRRTSSTAAAAASSPRPSAALAPPTFLKMDSSCSSTGGAYLDPPRCQSPYLEPQASTSSSTTSAYTNLVQPAVTHLVSETKKKRAKGLPTDYRARQNLVQLKHNKALTLLRPWLLDESEEKIYLRGDNVAFIQVKCPRALHAVDDFLERILNDESIEIVQCTAPLSRKRQGQLKGYLLYLKCKNAANVARIDEIFNQDFADSGLKCKTARFEKKSVSSTGSESSL